MYLFCSIVCNKKKLQDKNRKCKYFFHGRFQIITNASYLLLIFDFYFAVISLSSPEVIETEEVSVYDLLAHPDFQINIGETVVRIAYSTVPVSEGESDDDDKEQPVAGQVCIYVIIIITSLILL